MSSKSPKSSIQKKESVPIKTFGIWLCSVGPSAVAVCVSGLWSPVLPCPEHQPASSLVSSQSSVFVFSNLQRLYAEGGGTKSVYKQSHRWLLVGFLSTLHILDLVCSFKVNPQLQVHKVQIFLWSTRYLLLCQIRWIVKTKAIYFYMIFRPMSKCLKTLILTSLIHVEMGNFILGNVSKEQRYHVC